MQPDENQPIKMEDAFQQAEAHFKAHPTESRFRMQAKKITFFRIDYDDNVSQIIVAKSKKLGEGGFGSVSAIKHQDAYKREIVVKKLKAKDTTQDAKQRVQRDAKQEIDILGQLQSTPDQPQTLLVAHFSGQDKNGKTVEYIIMERATGQDLTKAILMPKDPDYDLGFVSFFPDKIKYKIAKVLLEQLKQAHDKKIIHRDIKPENIVLDINSIEIDPASTISAKYIDWGLALKCSKDSNTARGGWAGTPGYVAPEIKDDGYDNQFSFASDIYSLGIVLVDNLGLSDDKELEKMLSDNPTARPNLDTLLKHVTDKASIQLTPEEEQQFYMAIAAHNAYAYFLDTLKTCKALLKADAINESDKKLIQDIRHSCIEGLDNLTLNFNGHNISLIQTSLSNTITRVQKLQDAHNIDITTLKAETENINTSALENFSRYIAKRIESTNLTIDSDLVKSYNFMVAQYNNSKPAPETPLVTIDVTNLKKKELQAELAKAFKILSAFTIVTGVGVLLFIAARKLEKRQALELQTAKDSTKEVLKAKETSNPVLPMFQTTKSRNTHSVSDVSENKPASTPSADDNNHHANSTKKPNDTFN